MSSLCGSRVVGAVNEFRLPPALGTEPVGGVVAP
jgi:hypothetical protein